MFCWGYFKVSKVVSNKALMLIFWLFGHFFQKFGKIQGGVTRKFALARRKGGGGGHRSPPPRDPGGRVVPVPPGCG